MPEKLKPLSELANDVYEGDVLWLSFNESDKRLIAFVERKNYQGDEVHKSLTSVDLTSQYPKGAIDSKIVPARDGDYWQYYERGLAIYSLKGYEVKRRGKKEGVK